MEVVFYPTNVDIGVFLANWSFTRAFTPTAYLGQFLVSRVAVAPLDEVVEHSQSLGRLLSTPEALIPHLRARFVL
jgi:hypothetical protein